MKDTRIEIREDGGVGDKLVAAVVNNVLFIECDEPWVGDTETGFGRTAAVTLSKQQSRQLGELLLAFADDPDQKESTQ